MCNNTNYNLENLTDKNFQVNTNCFCSSDTTTIENGIYDGYDDITRGLVNYAIYDDSCSAVIDYIIKVELNEENSISENEPLWKIWQENSNLVINTGYEMVIGIYDLAGNVSSIHNLISGINIIPIKLSSGIYILSDEKGNRYRIYVGIQN